MVVLVLGPRLLQIGEDLLHRCGTTTAIGVLVPELVGVLDKPLLMRLELVFAAQLLQFFGVLVNLVDVRLRPGQVRADGVHIRFVALSSLCIEILVAGFGGLQCRSYGTAARFKVTLR